MLAGFSDSVADDLRYRLNHAGIQAKIRFDGPAAISIKFRGRIKDGLSRIRCYFDIRGIPANIYQAGKTVIVWVDLQEIECLDEQYREVIC